MCFVATARAGRSKPRVWLFRRYLPFILVALAILISQGLFLVFSLHWLPEVSPSLPASLTLPKPFKGGRHGGDDGHEEHPEKESHAANSRGTIDESDLAFVPPCRLDGPEVQSAVRRARSVHCKQRIADTYCSHRKGALFPTFLNSTCPTREGRAGERVGCFRVPSATANGHLQRPDYVANSSLAKQLPTTYPDAMSCVWACLRVGAPFALYTQQQAALTEETPCLCVRQPLDQDWQQQTDEANCFSPACKDCANLYKTGLPSQPKKHEPSSFGSAGENAARARIVFLLSVNGRAFRQIMRLITALRETAKRKHLLYVHVDQRQDYLYRSLKELEDPWLRVTSQRFSTIWGGSSLLQMLLSCFQELIHLDDAVDEWDYVINLSESDFPVKRVEELELFLGGNKGYNFVRSHGQDTPKFISKQALTKTFLECETRMWRIGDRELPRGIRLDGGSDWIALHRNFVQWIVQNRAHDSLLIGLETFFRHTLLPAESYFHTVLHNSAFCTLMVDNNLRFVNWRRKQGCKCQYKHVVDWCGCSPNVLLEDDITKLNTLKKRAVYFARKFEPVLSQAVIDTVEEKLLDFRRRPTLNPSSMKSYWQNEFQYLDRSPPVEQGRLSAWTSLARLSAGHLGNLGHRCILRTARVLEAWLYFKHDQFKGIIVQYEAKAEHLPEPVRIESLLSSRGSFRRSGKFENDPFDDRLRRIEISSDFDVKELLFRNFAGILGPQSEIGVLHEWDAGPASSVTFVWIDPAQVVAGSYEVKVSNGEQIQHHKPPLLKPLRPGLWTLKMFKSWVQMAEVQFIVFPQTHLGGIPIRNMTVARQVNGGPSKGYTDADLSTVEDFLGISKNIKKTLLKEAQLKSLQIGAALDEWADILSISRWSVEETCFITVPAHQTGGAFCPQLGIDPCHYTSWSTLAPDAKVMTSSN